MIVRDLTVQAWIRMCELREIHPAHANALRYGILTGMNLCLARAKIVDDLQGYDLTDILKMVTASVSLSELLKTVNDYLGSGEVIKAEMFEKLSYRTSSSGRHYNEGIRMGMEHIATVIWAVAGKKSVGRKTQLDFVRGHVDLVAYALAAMDESS